MKGISVYKAIDGKIFESIQECIDHDNSIPMYNCRKKLVDWFNDWYFVQLKMDPILNSDWVPKPNQEGTIWQTVEQLFKTGILEEIAEEYKKAKMNYVNKT